ncbi:FUSC family protein [Novosphingobium sp. M1R2S20]|uniref:FUSC family protein n=1 Tax=Novosphingobium rhizovicinum TaxID=3228928 RepID=A0ABV3R8B0_9SPHN
MNFDFGTVRSSFASEVRALVTPGPRMVDEFACVASVLLAIVFAHLIGAQMVAWAAFSAFVLMKGDWRETMLRGVLRIVGTTAGAGLGLAIVPVASQSLPLAMLAAAIFGSIGLYGMLTARRAYAWLLFGLTFEMVLLDKLEHPWLDTFEFARTRLLEVVAGTVACVVVSVTVALLSRRNNAANPLQTAPRMHWHPGAARHVAQAAVALALLPLLHRFAGIPELAQAGVTILAVMIVPLAGISGGGLVPVSRRLVHRVLGCLSGGAVAILILIAAHGSTAALVAGTCLGIVIGRHIENAGGRASYIGLQFTLAVLIVLVPDSYADVEIGPGLQRLVSILVGMAVLQPVLYAWHALSRREAGAKEAPPSGSTE